MYVLYDLILSGAIVPYVRCQTSYDSTNPGAIRAWGVAALAIGLNDSMIVQRTRQDHWPGFNEIEVPLHLLR